MTWDRLGGEAVRYARIVATLTRVGVVRPYGPRTLVRLLLRLRHWGIGFAGGVGALAERDPDGTAILDELGSLTWREVDERSTRLADGLRGLGVDEGDSAAVLVRNSRYFVEVSTALSTLGADLLYLNTAFSATQLGEVCAREQPSVVIHDEEFADLVERSGVAAQRVHAWRETRGGEVPDVEQLIERGSARRLRPPQHTSRPVILTSGTTGTPKGAPRGEAGLDGAVALLSRIPLRARGTTLIAAPLFHTWGWAHLNLAMLLGSTLVLRRGFDPEDFVAQLREHRCDAAVVIPVMMQRVMKLDPRLRGGDWSALRVVAASGSALPGDLGADWMDAFGEHLYNTYGSTEVAWATIATPEDMRAAPGTAGKPPALTVVRLYDEHDRPVPPGTPGRIFVGNSMLFGGYTGTGEEKKHVVEGLMSSGDVGRFDEEGRLFVEGRDDEMIVSGGENVFPQEVEDCLARHDSVADAAAVGVVDDDYGMRLRAFVVTTGDVDPESLEQTLKAHVRDNLARFKVPREIVVLDELPRNSTGKVLKKDLQ